MRIERTQCENDTVVTVIYKVFFTVTQNPGIQCCISANLEKKDSTIICLLFIESHSLSRLGADHFLSFHLSVSRWNIGH